MLSYESEYSDYEWCVLKYIYDLLSVNVSFGCLFYIFREGKNFIGKKKTAIKSRK